MYVYLNFDTRHLLKIKVHKHVLELAELGYEIN